MISDSSDYELILRVGAGEPAAYRELAERYFPVSVRFAEKILGNPNDAEDVVQDAFCRIWTQAYKWKQQAKFSTWLYRVIFNACIDYKRKKTAVLYHTMEMFEDKRPTVEDDIVERQTNDRLYSAMQLLSVRERAAISLCYGEGISNAEAADILGIKTGALQVTLFRARQKLKEILA